MYAIIRTGGKQYRVAKDDVLDVELLGAEDGANVEFKDVLFLFDGDKNEKPKIGKPSVSGCTVTAEVIGTVPGPKIVSIKYKPSHHQYRKFGHRQHYSRIKITAIGKKSKESKHGT